MGSKLGNIKAAETKRQRAIEAYYKCPQVCKQCSTVIDIRGDESPSIARDKNYCNQSCAAKFNNRDKPRRFTTSEPTRNCDRCGQLFNLNQKRSGDFRVRPHCDSCKLIVREDQSIIPNLTKAEVRTRYGKNTNGHSVIRAHSRKVYAEQKGSRQCRKCGYTTFIQVCHLKPLSEFPETALIREINEMSNLVALCPTHHWELDHGVLTLES